MLELIIILYSILFKINSELKPFCTVRRKNYQRHLNEYYGWIDYRVENATVYEYLGVKMDNSLSFKQQYDKVYKKAASWVKLLARIRPTISTHVAESIYMFMIKPILLYCHSLLLSSGTLMNRFQKIQYRAYKVVSGSKTINKWISIEPCINRLAILDVSRCLNGTAPSPYKDYF